MARHARVSLAGLMGVLVIATAAVLFPSKTASASVQGWIRDRSGGWACLGECSSGQYCCETGFVQITASSFAGPLQ